MKNLFIISNNSWNLYNFRYELIDKLSEKYKLFLFCNNDEYAKKLILNKKIYVIKANFKKNYFNIFKDISLFIKLLYFVIIYKPNYILSFTVKPNIYSLLITFFIKVRVVNNITGLGSIFIKQNVLNKIIFIVYKYLLRKSYFIFFQNTDDRKEICKNNIHLLKISDVLPGSGINLDKFKYKEISKKNINFIFIGRIIKDKGFFELINAIKKIKRENKLNINFNIIGNIDIYNPSSLSIEEFEKLKKLEIFQHYETTDKVNYFIEDSQCLILPSYREGCSKVIMEAMAIGRPIITTNVPGCNNLVKDEFNGFLVNPKDYKNLYSAIIKFHNLKYEKKLSMAKNSRNLIENNFDVNFVIKKYLDLINEI